MRLWIVSVLMIGMAVGAVAQAQDADVPVPAVPAASADTAQPAAPAPVPPKTDDTAAAPAVPAASAPENTAPAPEAQATPALPAAAVPAAVPPGPVASGAPATVSSPSKPSVPAVVMEPVINVSLPSEHAAYRSLLFAKTDMDKIYSASRTYLINLERAKRKGLPTVLPIKQEPGKEQTLEHPQFYLALIAYYNDRSWAVSLNGHTLTPNAPAFGEVNVTAVNKNTAHFVWKPKLFPVYADRPPAGDNPQKVKVNRDEESVEFTLFANQSFSAYSMSVEEGYLPPLREEKIITTATLNPELPGGLPSLPDNITPGPGAQKLPLQNNGNPINNAPSAR